MADRDAPREGVSGGPPAEPPPSGARGRFDEPARDGERAGGEQPRAGERAQVGEQAQAGEHGLPDELRALGRGLRIPDVDGESMAERVLARLLADSVPVPEPGPPPGPRGWPARGAALLRRGVFRRDGGGWRRRRRVLAAALAGLGVVLVLTPPVRAAVADWFGLGGVEVRYEPGAPPGASTGTRAPAVRVPRCGPAVTPAEAARRAGFTPRVPEELGAPEVVSVAEATPGRFVVSMCWTEGARTVRLDTFGASLDVGFVKRVGTMPRWVSLPGGSNGLWFEQPHLLRFRLVGADGTGWTESVRMAGPTLLWEAGDPAWGVDGESVTLRLEGVASPERARAIALSLR